MTVEITQLARTQCLQRFHLSDEQVLEAVSERDSVEIIKFDEASKLGLYFKRTHHRRPLEGMGSSLLVLGHFKGETLQVSSAFKIPASIDVSADPSTLAVLKRLVNEFGIKLTIGRQRAKFIFKERIEVSVDQLQIVSIEKPVENFITCFYMQMEKDKCHVQCVLCFALDMDSYIASLG